MFGAADDTAVVVVVSEVPGCAGRDGFSAAPAAGASELDDVILASPLSVVGGVVSAGLASAALDLVGARVLGASALASGDECGAVFGGASSLAHVSCLDVM